MDLHWESKLNKASIEAANEGREIAAKIRILPWKEGSKAEVAALRAQRCSLGRRVVGKKALKPFRRPETGEERSGLWDDKRKVGHYTRTLGLCKGIWRGRSYASMEQKCAQGNRPSPSYLASVLHEFLPEHAKVDFTDAAIEKWLDGSPAPKVRDLTTEEVRALPPFKPIRKPMKTGLLSWVGALLRRLA